MSGFIFNIRKSVFDKVQGKNVVLSENDLKILKRMHSGMFPEESYDPYEV